MEQEAKASDTGISAAGSGIYFCDNPEDISILSRKSIPRFAEYGETILRYSVELNWGKRLRQAA